MLVPPPRRWITRGKLLWISEPQYSYLEAINNNTYLVRVLFFFKAYPSIWHIKL